MKSTSDWRIVFRGLVSFIINGDISTDEELFMPSEFGSGFKTV